MIHCFLCAIALLIFMVQTVIAVSKYGYGYNTVLSSYCYCVQARGDRQLTRKDRALILRTERLLRTTMILKTGRILGTKFQLGKRGIVLRKTQLQEILV